MAKEGDQVLNLRRFDVKSMQRDRVCIFIGKRGTGKTTLVADILYQLRRTPVACVMSGTEESNSFYSSIVPPSFIHNGFNLETFESFINAQKRVARKAREGTFEGDPRSIILLDDCI